VGLLTRGELSARKHILLHRFQDGGQRRGAESLVRALHVVHKVLVVRSPQNYHALGRGYMLIDLVHARERQSGVVFSGQKQRWHVALPLE
jgi:hypothetical protein